MAAAILVFRDIKALSATAANSLVRSAVPPSEDQTTFLQRQMMRVPKHVSRREFVRLSGLAAGAAGLAVPATGRGADTEPVKRDPDSVLARLLEGNQRFVSGQPTHPRRKPADFLSLAEGQAPLAVVIGCADSRVS